jgi:hypothetical protein
MGAGANGPTQFGFLCRGYKFTFLAIHGGRNENRVHELSRNGKVSSVQGEWPPGLPGIRSGRFIPHSMRNVPRLGRLPDVLGNRAAVTPHCSISHSEVLNSGLGLRILRQSQICQVIGMGHPRECAWINARTGEYRFIHD